MRENHYRTLQVTRDAEPEVIERAYKALALKYHPDRRSATVSSRDATVRMQEINAAYQVLKDPVRRRRYDATLSPEDESGWDRFLEDGIVGLFRDRFSARR